MPALRPDYVPSDGSCKSTIEWIRSQMEGDELARTDFVTSGFTPSSLTEEFYRKALKDKNIFIREFFGADLKIRNAKVDYLNRALGRPDGTDRIDIPMEDDGLRPDDGMDQDAVNKVFACDNLLERERMIDNFLWEKADEITRFDDFTLSSVLAVVAKLCIIQRWLALDAQTGRQMLRTLVRDVRGTYGNIEFETLK